MEAEGSGKSTVDMTDHSEGNPWGRNTGGVGIAGGKNATFLLLCPGGIIG